MSDPKAPSSLIGDAAIDHLSDRFSSHFPVARPTWRTVGREAEYPVVSADGNFVDISRIWPHLAGPDLQVKREGGLIVEMSGQDFSYIAEVGRGTIEITCGPADDLHAIKATHEIAVARLVAAAAKEDAYVLGYGVQPSAQATPSLMSPKARYQALLERMGPGWLWFALTASDQVHVDICREEIIPMTNLGNLMASLTIALCANSSVYHREDSGHCSGREHAMGGIFSSDGRHGMPLRPYSSVREMVQLLAAQPYLLRREEGLLKPCQDTFLEYVERESLDSEALWSAYLLHEHYIWNSARPRAAQATVELRSACQQPWSEHMVAAALGLGIVEAGSVLMDFCEAALKEHSDGQPFDTWEVLRTWHTMVVRDGLAAPQPCPGFIEGALSVIQGALVQRARGEEVYLQPLWDRLTARQNPAQSVQSVFKDAGIAALVRLAKID